MTDIFAIVMIALVMVGIMGMVLVPTSPTHSRLRRIDQRGALVQWFGKYFSARTKRTTTLPWWTTPFHGL
jgi:hypothetical protein